MPTTVTYGTLGAPNSVVLTNVLTLDWVQEIVYDDTHTDQLFNRYRLTFQGLIHPDINSFTTTSIALQGLSSAPTAAGVYAQIKACLLEPRKALLVQIGDASSTDTNALSVLMKCDPSNLTASPFRDVENGPKPVSVQLTAIAGSRSFRAVWTVECAAVECCTPLSQVPVVLNNRWSISEEMDDNFFITRRLRGRLRISDASVPLHGFKKTMSLPPLEDGFRRVSVDFEAQADGLAADYSVVDKQVKTSAPWPSTKMECEHTEATANGSEYSSSCHVRIEGPPHASTKDLIVLAFAICDAKLSITQQLGIGPLGEIMVEDFSVTDYVGEHNSVEMSVRLIRTPSAENTGSPAVFLGVIRAKMGIPLNLPTVPGYDPDLSHVPAPWGYDEDSERDPAIVLYLLTCFLQTPCDNNHSMLSLPPSSPSTGSAPPLTKGTTTSSSTVMQLPPYPVQKYSDTGKASIWRYVRMESSYEYNPLRVQLPVAGDLTNVQSDSCRIVQLGRPQARRIIKYDAERVNEAPTAPMPLDSYQDGPLKGTLLRHKVTPMPPVTSPGGSSLIYRVVAEYVYAMNRAPLPGDTLLVGVLPFTKLDQDNNRFSVANGYDADIGPGPGGGFT